MQAFRASIEPLTAFGSALRGDTLFGQLCWALRHRHGEGELRTLLGGYVDGHPFCVVSDAFPAGYLPRPALPLWAMTRSADPLGKQHKRKRWVPLAAVPLALDEWLDAAVGDEHVQTLLPDEHAQPHNSISRVTGTTGKGAFAPYQEVQYWFGRRPRDEARKNLPPQEVRLDVHVLVDDARIHLDAIRCALDDVGRFGYGRNASTGLGKFVVHDWSEYRPDAHPQADAVLTLAPSAPQGQYFDPRCSFYSPFTRFGRHGDIAVQSGRPFKAPVLLADTGAVLGPWAGGLQHVGCGLGGAGRISKALPEAVQQGYAPVVPVRLPQCLRPEVKR